MPTRGGESDRAGATTSAGVDPPRGALCGAPRKGCIFCERQGTPLPLARAGRGAPRRCVIRRIRRACVEFCSRLAPDCATPWYRGTSCILASEEELRREIFRRDTSRSSQRWWLQGRVTDDAGRRIEAAKIRVWFQGTAIADEATGKDGSFRLRLPSAALPYTLRITHAGLATEIAEVRLASIAASTRPR